MSRLRIVKISAAVVTTPKSVIRKGQAG